MPTSSSIGIDLGGTKVAIARYSGDFEIEEQRTQPIEKGTQFESVLETVITLIEEFKKPETRAIGVGVPGLIRHSDGTLLKAPNIKGSENIPLQKIISERTGLPVSIENDSNCFALAEAIEGAGKGHNIVIGVTMGTGVGGGIVIDGKIFHGSHGIAGEIGHMLLRPSEPPFKDSHNRGEVEQFLSGTAMGKRCEAAKRPEDYLEGEVCSFLRPEVFKEVAWLCTNLSHLIDPSIIIFGGSTGRALKSHLKEIEKELKVWMLPGSPLPELAVADLADSSTRGAALVAAHPV